MKNIWQKVKCFLDDVMWFFEEVIECYKYAATHREWLPSLILSHVALVVAIAAAIVRIYLLTSLLGK